MDYEFWSPELAREETIVVSELALNRNRDCFNRLTRCQFAMT